MADVQNLDYGAFELSDRNQQITMWKPTQNVTTGNSNFTSGFEAAPKIFPLISLHIGELNKRGGLDSIGIEKEHSPVSPLLELRVHLTRFSN